MIPKNVWIVIHLKYKNNMCAPAGTPEAKYRLFDIWSIKVKVYSTYTHLHAGP